MRKDVASVVKGDAFHVVSLDDVAGSPNAAGVVRVYEYHVTLVTESRVYFATVPKSHAVRIPCNIDHRHGMFVHRRDADFQARRYVLAETPADALQIYLRGQRVELSQVLSRLEHVRSRVDQARVLLVNMNVDPGLSPNEIEQEFHALRRQAKA